MTHFGNFGLWSPSEEKSREEKKKKAENSFHSKRVLGH